MRTPLRRLIVVAALAAGIGVAAAMATRWNGPPAAVALVPPPSLAPSPAPAASQPALAAAPVPVVAVAPEAPRGPMTIRLLDHAVAP